jgi:glucose/arabinose dehydrogenase
MRRLFVLMAIASLALPALAVANDTAAQPYRTTLAPVPTGASAPTGKAHLVDGKKNNTVTIEAKGLVSGTSYPWHVHAFAAGVTDPCAPGAAQGPVVASFEPYGPLTGNADGNGSARAWSPSFNWGAASNQYYVNIHDPVTLAPIACGLLTR